MNALAGLAAAVVPAGARGPGPERVAELVRRHVARFPVAPRLAVRSGAWLLDGAALATTGRRLGSLSPERRTRLLERLAAANPASSLAVDSLKALVLLAWGADAHAGDLLDRSRHRAPARPDAALDVTMSTAWPSTVSTDVVIVGSGAGGAMVARTLAAAGLSVVVIEEGRRFGVDDFREGHPLDRFGALYRDGGATVALGRPPVLLPMGRGVGGTTLVNSGTCYRPPLAVQRRWRDVHGLALADPDELGVHLADVESMLQVAPVPAEVMGRTGELLLAGAAALGWRAGPLRRNAPGCGGCCQCAIGCPHNAKFGVHLNALPEACASGARIVSEARVLRLLHEHGRATGVLARRPDGSAFRILAPRVVVAAGATQAPPLLRRSGLAAHREVGRNLSLHPSLGVAGRFEEPVMAWRGVLQSAAVEEFHRSDGILVEATSTPPGMGSMAFPGYGPELLRLLRDSEHLATVGVMIGDAASGRVIGRGSSPLLRYDLAPDDGRRLVRALGIASRLLLAAGAVEVITGVRGVPSIRRERDVDTALAGVKPRDLHLAAFHPTGTVRAGADPARYPVDPDGRLRGVSGVWVADASLLPSCPEVNPQVAIMAVARAVAVRINP